MTYENGGQLDRALKRAVRDRGGDPGDGCRRALRDRFLRRVFSNPDGRFILKGGSGLLARIPDGRVTRDIDFATASVFDSVQFTGWGCGGNPGPKEDQDFHRSPTRKSGLTKHRRSAARVLPEGDRLLCGLGRGGRAGVRCHQPQAPQAPGVQDALRGPLLRGVAVALRIQARKGASKGILTTL